MQTPNTTLTASARPQAAQDISPAQTKVILRALKRGLPHYICPTPGLGPAPQQSVLKALHKRGLITDATAPTLTADGILLADSLKLQPEASH